MTPAVNAAAFRRAFAEFRTLYAEHGQGHPFAGFHEGFAAVWEDYKPRLRERARQILGFDNWRQADIGAGQILDRVIAAIEIQDPRANLVNNLVFWQNRYGPANQEHRALIAARNDAPRRREFETLFFDLYVAGGDEGAIFDRLSALAHAKYPLLAYLFFIKDMDRFAPIQPTGYDRAFKAMDIPFVTLGQCGWANYSAYVVLLDSLRDPIATEAKLANVRLIDAHSFCWIYSTLIKLKAQGDLAPAAGQKDSGRVISGRRASIIEMRESVLSTVAKSNGQTVASVVKNKNLLMEVEQLERLIEQLLDEQENRCNLTGIPLQFKGAVTDDNFKPSLDRIDSNGHYAKENLQVVCRFINFWKGAGDNETFRRLLERVREPDSD